jgi:NAD(P)-dependent dehydrogenase (short-subunit alcohol dehydrogenase family)
VNIALRNKVVVVIGATSGIGLAAAKAILSAGGKVVGVGKDDATGKKAAAALGAEAEILTADASDPATAELAVSTAMETFGRFDALYHVAGGSARTYGDGPLHELTDEGVDFAINLNLKSVLYSNRAAVGMFLRQKTGGAVLNLGSVLAEEPSPGYIATHAYAAAKSAVVGLTRSAAAYYARKNIRFNALAPGLTDTPMASRALTDPQIVSFVKSKQPLDGGRIGTPDDLAAAAVFLLSDASKFITGQVLAVDGGWSVADGGPGIFVE